MFLAGFFDTINGIDISGWDWLINGERGIIGFFLGIVRTIRNCFSFNCYYDYGYTNVKQR